MTVVPAIMRAVGTIQKLDPTQLNASGGHVVTMPATANAIMFSADGGNVRYTIDSATEPVQASSAADHVGWLVRTEANVLGPYIVYLPPGASIRFKRGTTDTGAYVQYQLVRFTVA